MPAVRIGTLCASLRRGQVHCAGPGLLSARRRFWFRIVGNREPEPSHALQGKIPVVHGVVGSERGDCEEPGTSSMSAPIWLIAIGGVSVVLGGLV